MSKRIVGLVVMSWFLLIVAWASVLVYDLSVGEGSDMFIISDAGDSNDTIADFEIGVDTLLFDADTKIDELGDLNSKRVKQVGDDLVIDLGNNELTLEGVSKGKFIEFVQSDAAADYFIFQL
jgi:hypothetical protein